MKREMSQCCVIKQYTDREVTANRPDIIIKNENGKTCTLIDVAIRADRNVVQKEAEKKLKYKRLLVLQLKVRNQISSFGETDESI